MTTFLQDFLCFNSVLRIKKSKMADPRLYCQLEIMSCPQFMLQTSKETFSVILYTLTHAYNFKPILTVTESTRWGGGGGGKVESVPI